MLCQRKEALCVPRITPELSRPAEREAAKHDGTALPRPRSGLGLNELLARTSPAIAKNQARLVATPTMSHAHAGACEAHGGESATACEPQTLVRCAFAEG